VEGNYPNYRQVIPTDFKERVTVVREELLQALRRAEIMTSDKSNSVKLAFTKNNLAITANTPEVGEAQRKPRHQLQGDRRRHRLQPHLPDGPAEGARRR
jgi:DNA polymerase III sliding clamp (beta) subunit (PCNA family)